MACRSRASRWTERCCRISPSTSRRRSRRSPKRPKPRWRRNRFIVIAGLDPAIHPFEARWMPGSGPGMTLGGVAAMSDLATLEQSILADITSASDEAALEAVRVAALGKKGSISALLSTLGKMSPEERKSEGAKINLAKDAIMQALAARRELLKSAALDARLASETIDVTLPLRDPPAEAGRIHPLSQVMDELTTIFADMGFAIAEGPDIETDDYNFTKLNFPEGHPAREMHDTFFFNPKSDPGSEPGAGG